MRIEGSSLIRYLCTALEEKMEDGRIPRDAIERSLKTALSFSPEGWSAGSDEGRSILDPSSVISRLFCVEVEKKMRLALESEGISKELPWVLRILDENGGWRAGEFLRYFGDEFSHGMSNRAPLRSEFLQAMQHFPILFEDSPDENLNERIIDRMKSASSILEESNLLHISHPKFHKEWSDLVGSAMEETPAGVMAKQHWSSVISREIEEAVRGSQIGVVLQAVGGHVLVAVKERISATTVKDALKKVQDEWHLHVNADLKDVYDNKGKEELKEICSAKSLKTTGNKSVLIGRLIGRGWSPSLWGSWAGGACGVPLLNDGKNEDEIVSKLAGDYEKDSDTRERSRLRWATFAWNTNDRKSDDPEMVMYLDVMGLGERCWSKGYSTYYCPECGKQAEEWGFERVGDDDVVLFDPETLHYEEKELWEAFINENERQPFLDAGKIIHLDQLDQKIKK